MATNGIAEGILENHLGKADLPESNLCFLNFYNFSFPKRKIHMLVMIESINIDC